MILTDADHLREALELVRHERDMARAEVKRLRQDFFMLDEHSTFRDALREIAKRQRQACADYMAAERWYTTLACLSAPLVTDERGEP